MIGCKDGTCVNDCHFSKQGWYDFIPVVFDDWLSY